MKRSQAGSRGHAAVWNPQPAQHDCGENRRPKENALLEYFVYGPVLRASAAPCRAEVQRLQKERADLEADLNGKIAVLKEEVRAGRAP